MMRTTMAWLFAHAFELFLLFVLLCVVENILRARQGLSVVPQWHYPLGTTSLLIELGLRNATLPLRWWCFSKVAELVPWKHHPSLPLLAASYVLCDFIYYLKHRWMHTSPLGWALHAPHHSPTELNLMTGVRLGWAQRQLDDFFFLPVLLTGVSPDILLIVVLVNEAFPFWLHTESIGRLGWLEYVFNSPQAHRAHHHRDAATAFNNFGSTFAWWDILFRTFSLATVSPQFGIADFKRPNHLVYAQGWMLWQWLTRSLTLRPLTRTDTVDTRERLQ